MSKIDTYLNLLTSAMDQLHATVQQALNCIPEQEAFTAVRCRTPEAIRNLSDDQIMVLACCARLGYATIKSESVRTDCMERGLM